MTHELYEERTLTERIALSIIDDKATAEIADGATADLGSSGAVSIVASGGHAGTTTADARVVAFDPRNDVAYLSVEWTGVPPAGIPIADLRPGNDLPAVERQIDDASAKLAELQAETTMLKEEVLADEISEIVGKWTGIPVVRLLQG